MHNHVHIMKHIETLDYDLFAVDAKGLNALHHACESNSFESCSYLVALNFSPFKETKQGFNAFDLCRTNKLRMHLQQLYYE